MTLTKILLAVASLACSPSFASEKPEIRFESDFCAYYKGSFDSDGFTNEAPVQVKAVCKLVDNKANCNIVFFKPQGTVNFDFVGTVKKVDNVIVVTTFLIDGEKVITDNVARFAIRSDGFGIFQGYVESTQTGMMCASKFPKNPNEKAKKPAPEPTPFQGPPTTDI